MASFDEDLGYKVSIPLWFDSYDECYQIDNLRYLVVSIPLWFDSYGCVERNHRKLAGVSIPLWFDSYEEVEL